MSEPVWVTSSFSQGGDCVEWAVIDGGREVWLRNSRDREGPVLRFTPTEWSAFTSGVRNGEADA